MINNDLTSSGDHAQVADAGNPHDPRRSVVEDRGVGRTELMSEPERGRRQWTGQPEEQAALYANRRCITGGWGLALLRQRSEWSERPFAHQLKPELDGGPMCVVGRRCTKNLSCRRPHAIWRCCCARCSARARRRDCRIEWWRFFLRFCALAGLPIHRRLTGEVSDKSTLTLSRLRRSTVP